jgi:GMP synthase (glutamine-hydrolysing)
MKNVLLVDAVAWSNAYAAEHPLKNVARWFIRWFGDIDNFTLMRVSAEDDPAAILRHRTQGVIVSGSPRDAWNDDPVNARLCELIAAWRDRGVPVLGVCYGHQILGRALGGQVARHPAGLALGNTTVELTPAGRNCALFAGLPDRFEVLSSHADAVLEMPPGCTLLARSAHTEIEAFHWNHQLFGVQFHPETDPEVLHFLWQPRRETWRSRVSFDLDATLAALRPTPAGAAMLRNFVQRILP